MQKRISNIEQGISNDEVLTLRYLPALFVAGLFLVQYSAVLFYRFLTSNHFVYF